MLLAPWFEREGLRGARCAVLGPPDGVRYAELAGGDHAAIAVELDRRKAIRDVLEAAHAGDVVHGVTRLEALAHGLPRPITVIEDARRGEVYVQSFFADGPSPARIARADAIGDTEPQTTGSAAQGLPEAMPLVEAIARIAASRPGVQPRPAPFYLRGADAAPPSDPPPTILPDPVGA